MGQLEKLLERIRNNPKTVRFEELDKILMRFGFSRQQASGGSSHYNYRKGKSLITIPKKKPYINRVYVEQALEALVSEAEEEEV